jgi:TonB-linked SusC/RagA family outer membrane protein
MSHSLSRVLAGACLGLAVPALVQAQQSATISGRVTNQAGQGLPAVSVFIPTLNFGTTTRADGSFSFSVPAARVTGQAVTLTARQVGYRAQSVTITLRGGTITQDFSLEAAPTTLAQVVVTGAGTVSTRERLGNVINSVDSTSIRRAVEPANVVSALAAKAPNVEVRTQSGEPGAGASIRIRGATGVLGSQEPLFVVDGQPIDNSTNSTGSLAFSTGNEGTVTQNRASDINPSDVASVEILKGAAAAAIYGARAANGVVLITTKRGRAGATRYTLQSTTTADRIYARDILQRAYGLGSGGAAPSCFGPTAPLNCSVILDSAGAWGPSLQGQQSFDHIDAVYATGNTLDNQLQVTGGGDRTTFFISGGSTRQGGVLRGPNNFLNTTSLRLRASQQILRDLTVEGNVSYVDKDGAQVQKGSNTSGLLLGTLRTPPNFDNREFISPTTGLHRSYRRPNPSATSLTQGRGYDNPFFTLNNPGNRNELGRVIGNVRLNYTPLTWLTVNYVLGADNFAEDRRQSLPLTSSGRPDGQVFQFTQSQLQVDHQLTATGRRDFGQNLTASLTLGQNLNQRRYRSTLVQGNTLVAPEPLNLQNTLSYVPTQFRSTQRIAAYYAQGTADLYDQLFLTGVVRRDGFSTFGQSNRFATFPSVSAAWSFSRFLKPRLGQSADEQGLWSFGKLRFGYGETGKEPPVYATVTTLSVGQANFGSGFGDFLNAGQGGQGALINGFQLGNTALKPERSVEREYGVDLGFFDQRATLGVTYYNKRTGDAILSVPVSPSATGSGTALRNAATISNKGLEVELNTVPLRGRSYEWNLGLQFGRNRNRVESLAGAQFVSFNTEGFTGAIGSATVGYPVGTIRGNDFARCGRGLSIDVTGDGTPDSIDQLCGTGAAKDALFLNADGFPVFDETERVIGVTQPDFTTGLNSSLRLGRFTLTTTMDWRRGGQVWNGTRGILYTFGTHRDTEIRSQQGAYGRNWQTKEYPVVAGPGASANVTPFQTAADWQGWLQSDGGGFGNVGAQFIESASFFKLRELGLSYDASGPWVRQRLGLSGVQLRLVGRNLFMATNYRGFDPEANLGGSEFITQGFDYFNNPMSRSGVLTVTLTR